MRRGKLSNDSQRIATVAALAQNQIVAIEALMAGQSVSQAAQAAGINRTTLWRWMKGDAEFQACLNSYRLEVIEHVFAQTWRLAPLAIAAVEGALKQGDVKIGIAVLRSLGVMDGTRPELPNDDLEELQLRQRRASWKRLTDSMDAPP